MTTSYLITLAVIGCFTLIALRPPRRPRALAQLADLMGLTVNEVPHLAAGLPLAVATAQAITAGDLSLGGSSLFPGAAAAIVAAGLLTVAHRGMRAWPAVTTALADAGVSVPNRPRGWAWRTLLTPFPFRSRQIVRIVDVPYGDHRRQRLDIYHHRDHPRGGPVLVYLHGGGYYSGGKHREGRALLHRLAARGWVCVSANYRLRPTAGFDEHLADARQVLGWARTHADEYGGDPRRVVMAGSSAGAHLTSLLALEPRSRLAAAICLYGHYGRYYGRNETETTPSTPFALPMDNAPAFFIAHGDHDTWTPVDAARRLAAQLRRTSPNPVVYAELPGGQHGFDLWRSWRCSAVVDGIEAFVSDPAIDVRRPTHLAPTDPREGTP
jgi:acetyl esterase/lipase